MTRSGPEGATPGVPARSGAGPTVTLESHCVAETIHLGAALGAVSEPNDILALVGPLGAGKTQLVKGVAEGLAVADKGRVSSPTFVLVQRYEGRLAVWHVDAYRLNGPEDLWDIGFEEICRCGGVVLVEWADRTAAALPEDVLWIQLEPVGEQRRRLLLRPTGAKSGRLLERFARSIDERWRER